jgi:hypothetical protein
MLCRLRRMSAAVAVGRRLRALLAIERVIEEAGGQPIQVTLGSA